MVLAWNLRHGEQPSPELPQVLASLPVLELVPVNKNVNCELADVALVGLHETWTRSAWIRGASVWPAGCCSR